MDKQAILSIIHDPDVQQAIHSLTEKGLVETVSFIAVTCATLISIVALALSAFQLRGQIKEWNNSSQDVAKQLSLLKLTMEEDHRRSRREFAVDLIRSWTSIQRHETASVKAFVEELKYEECLNLFEKKPFTVNPSAMPHLLACLQHSFKDVKEADVLDDNKMVLSVYASHIRFTVISYLNSLEAVMTAWKHSIVDREIIKEEFAFLWNRTANTAALLMFRQAIRDSTEVEAFPGIDEFIRELQRRAPAPSQLATGTTATTS